MKGYGWIKSRARCCDIEGAQNFRSRSDIPSLPEALWMSSFLRIEQTSALLKIRESSFWLGTLPKSAWDSSPKSGMSLQSADSWLCLIKKQFSVSAFSRSVLADVFPGRGLLRSKGGIGVLVPCPSRALVNWKRLGFGWSRRCSLSISLKIIILDVTGGLTAVFAQCCYVKRLGSSWGGGHCIPLLFKFFPVVRCFAL